MGIDSSLIPRLRTGSVPAIDRLVRLPTLLGWWILWYTYNGACCTRCAATGSTWKINQPIFNSELFLQITPQQYYRIMVWLWHNVRNLRPPNAIFELGLIGFRLHCLHMCVQIRSRYVIEYGTANHILLLLVPSAAPHYQANQRQRNDQYGNYARPNRKCQNITVDFTLAAIEIIHADAR